MKLAQLQNRESSMSVQKNEQAKLITGILFDIQDLQVIAAKHQMEDVSILLGACHRKIFSVLLEKSVHSPKLHLDRKIVLKMN
jgi:hypothetical protein